MSQESEMIRQSEEAVRKVKQLVSRLALMALRKAFPGAEIGQAVVQTVKKAFDVVTVNPDQKKDTLKVVPIEPNLVQKSDGEIDQEKSVKKVVAAVAAAMAIEGRGMELNKEGLVEHLHAMCINTAENKELLETVPHHEVADLSIVPTYQAGNGSFLITNDMSAKMQMSPYEVFQQAVQNSKKEPLQIAPINQMLGIETGGDFPELPVWVVTNEKGFEAGGVPFFSKQARQEIMDKVGGEYYLLPSSIHETIAVRKDCGVDLEGLKEMVGFVNATEVAPWERLSGNVYEVTKDLKLSVAGLAVKEAEAKTETMTKVISMAMGGI